MNFTSETKQKIKMFGNTMEQAKYVLDESPMFFDESGLWWTWNSYELKYEMVDEIQICNLISECIPDDILVKANIRNELLFALKMESRKRKPKEFKKTWIQFKNKIYDYQTGEIFNAEPVYFNTNPIPFDIGNETATPIIDKLFTDWVGADEVITLKEVCAFCLVQDYFLHRIVCLTGSGCNGKGVFLRFIQKLLGNGNCTSTELDLLIKNTFGTSSLYKKLVCIMGETDFGVLSSTGRIKALSGNDLIQAQFKGKNSFDFYSYAKLLIATNTIPATTDKTDGFYRRWLIVDFPNKFKEGTDPLQLIPDVEYSNFLRQLFPMIMQLKTRGMFSNDGDIEHRKKRYEAKSNPFPRFIKENYAKGNESDYVDSYEMFNLFDTYLQERGLRKITFSEFRNLCKAENLEISEERVYKEMYDKETQTFRNKQVRVKYIYNLVLIDKTKRQDKTEKKSQEPYKDEKKILSVLSYCLKNDENKQEKVYQYIKNHTGEEFFLSDFSSEFETNEEIEKILSCLVTRGDLMLTANNGYKVVLK